MSYLILLFLVLAFIANIKPNRSVLGTFAIDWAEKLQATRLWLQDVNAQINDPQNYQRLTGTLNYLFSGLNPTTINTNMLDNAGMSEYRPVQVRYIPHKGTANLQTTDSSGTCTKVAQRLDILQTVQPTLYAEDKFTIEENYVQQNAENGFRMQQRLNKEFRDSMRVVRESINAQSLGKLASVFGSNPAAPVGAGSYYGFNSIVASSGKIDDVNFDVIKNHQEDNFQAGEVGIIGLGNARRYMNRLAVGNANDNGIDYREVANEFGMLLFKDSDTLDQLGDANYALALYPGHTQFFQYNLYRGDFALNHGNLIKGTMSDPILPITYDYILKYDDNCSTGNGLQGAWIGRVFTYFDIWNVAEDAFGDTYSELNDFNGVVGYDFQSA